MRCIYRTLKFFLHLELVLESDFQFFQADMEYLNLYICSFHYDLVLRLKKAYPHLKVGLIIGYTMNENKDITPFDFLSVHYYSANKYEKDIFIWTVNCPIVFKRIPNSLGVITDSSYILKEEHIN